MNQIEDCSRKEELITWIYGEMGEPEKSLFARHIEQCASCRDEVSAFAGIREELEAWQPGFVPPIEIKLPVSHLATLRELLALFPPWARGVAMTGLTACLILIILIASGSRDGFIARQSTANSGPGGEIVRQAVDRAVARERARLETEYQASVASLRAETSREMEAIRASQEARIEQLHASLRSELRKSGRQKDSIRSYFASDFSSDDGLDQWTRGGQE